jgi:hypothetical protein
MAPVMHGTDGYMIPGETTPDYVPNMRVIQRKK